MQRAIITAISADADLQAKTDPNDPSASATTPWWRCT
jgi:hypothetical protein